MAAFYLLNTQLFKSYLFHIPFLLNNILLKGTLVYLKETIQNVLDT